MPGLLVIARSAAAVLGLVVAAQPTPCPNPTILTVQDDRVRISFPDRYVVTGMIVDGIDWGGSMSILTVEPLTLGTPQPSIVLPATGRSDRSLRDWVHESNASGIAGTDTVVEETTVAGRLAINYGYTLPPDGAGQALHVDVIAIAVDRDVYIASVSWLAPDDPIRADFARAMETLSIEPPRAGGSAQVRRDWSAPG